MVKKETRALSVVFLTVFVDMLGFGILVPVIPMLFGNPHSSYFLLKHSGERQGFFLLGLLIAAYPLAQLVATPILGELSDKFGRKKILLISLAGTFVSYLFSIYAVVGKTVTLLFMARILDGMTGGNISVAQAVVADVSTKNDKARNFGLIGAAFGLGFILGPYIGGKLSDPKTSVLFNIATPFVFAAILSLVNVLSIWFFLPETLKEKNRQKKITWNKFFKNLLSVFSMKRVRGLLLTNFLFQGGFAFFTSFVSVFLIFKYGFTQGRIGDFFSYIGIWVAIAQIFIMRFIVKKYRQQDVLSVSLFGAAITTILFFVPHGRRGLFFIAPFFALFIGLAQAYLLGFISETAEDSMQGEILGINSSIQALAQSIPPIISGYVAARINPEFPIIVSALVVLASGILFTIVKKPHSLTGW